MKLMDIDADTLGIPETDYDARVTMTAGEFSRIVRDLSTLGESVRIEVSKEGVRFASDGESANGSVLLKQTDAARAKYRNYGKDDNADQGGADEDEEEEGDNKKDVKTEGDVEMNGNDDEEDGEAEFKAKSDDEGEGEDGEEEKTSKKRKAPAKVLTALCFIRPYLPSCRAAGNLRRRLRRVKMVSATVEYLSR